MVNTIDEFRERIMVLKRSYLACVDGPISPAAETSAEIDAFGVALFEAMAEGSDRDMVAKAWRLYRARLDAIAEDAAANGYTPEVAWKMLMLRALDEARRQS